MYLRAAGFMTNLTLCTPILLAPSLTPGLTAKCMGDATPITSSTDGNRPIASFLGSTQKKIQVLCFFVLTIMWKNMQSYCCGVLSRFSGLDFLMKMRGKSVMFVGDSLGRNQWESLICMISTSVPRTQTQMQGGDPFSSFKFLVRLIDFKFQI